MWNSTLPIFWSIVSTSSQLVIKFTKISHLLIFFFFFFYAHWMMSMSHWIIQTSHMIILLSHFVVPLFYSHWMVSSLHWTIRISYIIICTIVTFDSFFIFLLTFDNFIVTLSSTNITYVIWPYFYHIWFSLIFYSHWVI